MSISIVVPVFNEEKYLRKCLEHIFNQEEKASQVIIVDNNCTDSSIEIAKKFPVHIVQEKKQGMIHARNTGFNHATSPIIARTDADTQVPKNWVKQIKENFEKNEIVGLSGPAAYYELPFPESVSKLPTIVFFWFVEQKIGFESLFGPNMALRKTAWDKIKDTVCTQTKQVHEDIDLAMHLHPFGEILFDPNLIVETSLRRWESPKSYLDYSLLLLKTFTHQKEIIHS